VKNFLRRQPTTFMAKLFVPFGWRFRHPRFDAAAVPWVASKLARTGEHVGSVPYPPGRANLGYHRPAQSRIDFPLRKRVDFSNLQFRSFTTFWFAHPH
jgi:hypothetical protein